MTKKAIITTHDGREATIVTKASNVLFEDGQTAQDILNDRQDTMISPIITTSTSIAKVGQGDDVDYSENVVDGAYESCVLKGNTRVNLIQESSSQDVVLPYEFTEGQSVTISDTKESGALGIELKGQTLVNLASGYESLTNNDNVFTVYSDGIYTYSARDSYTNSIAPANMLKIKTPYKLKPNTSYTVMVTQLTGGESKFGVRYWDGIGNIDTVEHVAKTGVHKHCFTTTNNEGNTYVELRLGHYSNERSISFKDIVILEGDYTNVDIPYFEGMKSVEAPSVTTVGKNLFDYNSYVDTSGVTKIENGFRVTGWAIGQPFKTKLKPNTTYSSSYDYKVIQPSVGAVDNAGGKLVIFNGSRYINITGNKGANFKFTTPSNINTYTQILFYADGGGGSDKGEVEITNIQIEESTTPTTYEPYKSSTLTTSEEVVLRKVGNVCDTLNLQTGECVQRIGEVVLDGSEDEGWVKSIHSTDGFPCFATDVVNSKATGVHHGTPCMVKSDRFTYNSNVGHNTVESEGINNIFGSIRINISSSKLSTADVQGLKTYLQQNPITVQYELAEPITTTVSLTFTDQDNQPTTKLSTYNTTTHINTSSQEGSLIPTLSHSNPNYPVILKPSTKYSIVANSYSNDHTNSAINFNLGGATATTTVGNRVTTITTLSTLSNELLTMSGRGNKLNNVMVIEGDVAGDEPYFEGMCDSKSPILTNLDANNEQSNTTTFNQKDDKTIVLRSLPNGVCDTLNVETGEYVQRIGEVTLDGTKRFGRNMPESEYNKPCVRVSCGSLLVNGSNAPHFNMKADKIAIGHYSYDMNYPVMAGLHEQALYIYIPRTIIGLTTNDNDAESIANAFNSWLTRNPITVQYPLATPIVSIVDIQGFPYAYENGHVQLSSGSIEQSLTPTVEYSVATNRNGQIRSNQKMVERHQKQLDQLQAIILANLVNSQYNQTLTTLKYELSRV